MSTPLKRIAAPLAGLALLLTGCSGAGEQSSPTPPPPISPVTTTDAATPGDTETSAPGDASPSAAPSSLMVPTSDDTSTPAGASGPAQDTDLANYNGFVSAEDAVATANESLGGTVHQVELEYSSFHKAWVYKVDILVGTTDNDVELDATSGEVLKTEQDDENDTKEAVDLAAMSPTDAMAAAIGAQAGTVAKWSLEWEDGKQIYDVDVRSGNDTVDVIVDVASREARVDD